jgi:hypothetical protein
MLSNKNKTETNGSFQNQELDNIKNWNASIFITSLIYTY